MPANQNGSGKRIATYGGQTGIPLTWRCLATWPTQTISIGATAPAGGLAALGLYLHAQADRGSHFDCIDHVNLGGEMLKAPIHHGLPGSDLCSGSHHADELTTNSTGLNEVPLWRSLTAVLGSSAATWQNGGVDPASGKYASLPGVYQLLLDYRAANPLGLTFPYAGIPSSVSDANFQELVSRTASFFNANSGWNNVGGRVQSASTIQSWCSTVVPGL